MVITNLEAYGQANSLLPSATRNAASVDALPGSKQLVEQSEAVEANQQDVESAVKQINAFISPVMQSIQFSTDSDSGRTVVKVVDAETQKVLRQIPNEEVLAISKTLDKLQGLIIRQTA